MGPSSEWGLAVGVFLDFGHFISASANWHGDYGIPHRLEQHLAYTFVSLAIAAALALPVGLVTGHTGRGGFVMVQLANAVRALPTVGIILLVIVLTGAVHLAPVILALVALAIPSILVNTDAGIRSVDPDARDAARGMGMRWWQVLIRVEIPVALPLILLGLRTAAFQVVSTATLAAYITFGGLGRFIFDGLQTQQYDQVVGGAVLVSALAVLSEALFLLAGRVLVSRGVRLRT